jgi:hypothetical protein
VVDNTRRPLEPRKRPGIHCAVRWVGLEAGVDGTVNIAPTGIRSPGRPAHNIVWVRGFYLPTSPRQWAPWRCVPDVYVYSQNDIRDQFISRQSASRFADYISCLVRHIPTVLLLLSPLSMQSSCVRVLLSEDDGLHTLRQELSCIH